MSSLHLPASARPNNLHLQPHQIRWELDGDTLNWLRHLPEEVQDGDRLFVVIHENHPQPFVVMEHCTDGVDRFVLRSAKLGAHEYHLLRRARFIPLKDRLAAFEEEERHHDQHMKEERAAEAYERMGGHMYRLLHRHGFADGRAESYPMAGPKYQRAKSGRAKQDA